MVLNENMTLDFKLFDGVIEKLKEQNKIAGTPFYRFFKDHKWAKNHLKYDKSLKNHIDSINKEEIIILSPNHEQLDKLEPIKKKVIFPFSKIFLEYPIIEFIIGEGNNPLLQFTDGFFIDNLKNDKNETYGILFVSYWLDYGRTVDNLAEEGVTPRIILLPYNNLNSEINFEGKTKEEENQAKRVIEALKKICFLIQKDNYGEYYKWSPNGIEKKEIYFSRNVKSHKRHFWQDSGRFKICNLPKEEVLSLGYEIDELVFRNNELRRDVPFRVIGNYKTGKEKKLRTNNRIISVLKARIWKQQEKLGNILYQLFPNEFIKRNDRKAIKPLELDFYIKNLNLAFEYDGEQHFDKKICEEVFGSNFEDQVKRDRKKDIICRNKGIRLIRIKFDESLGINLIKRKLKDKQNNQIIVPLTQEKEKDV